MTTLALVKECLLALKDRTGSSVPAINKWIETEKKVEVKKHILKAALKRGVETEVLVPVKNSYKLSPEAKKPPKKKAAPKKKTAPKKKKTAPKKKTATKKKTAPKKTVAKKVAPKKTAPKKKKTTKKTKK